MNLNNYIGSDGDIHGGIFESNSWVDYYKGTDSIILDGDFSITELKEIVKYMEDNLEKCDN